MLLEVVKEMDPEQGKNLESALRAFHFKLIVNQMRRQDNPNIGGLVCKIIEKHLGLRMRFAGNISFDERVHDAVCQNSAFSVNIPIHRRRRISEISAAICSLHKRPVQT